MSDRRILTAHLKKSGYLPKGCTDYVGTLWRTVVEVKSGREDTQAKAVVTGQAALMARTYRHWVDK
jgi:hypothetical protein